MKPESPSHRAWRHGNTVVARVYRAVRFVWHHDVVRLWRRILRLVLHHTARWTWYAGAAVVVLLAALFTIARVLLPDVAGRKAEIEQRLGQMSEHPVRIERLGTFWDGLSPGLDAQGVAILARDQKSTVVRLERIKASLALVPLLWGEVRVSTLILVQPRLALERRADRRYQIRGFDPVEPTPQADGGGAFLAWLFRQHRVVIEDGELTWLDHLERDRPIQLRRVNATLRNDGQRHRLAFDAAFPQDMCRRCAFVVDLRGNPLTDPAWDGSVYVQTDSVDIAQLPRVLREHLAERLRGRFTAELWSEWKDARPTSVTGHLQVSQLVLPIARRELRVQETNGGLEWERRGDGWRLLLKDFALGLTAAPRTLGTMRITHQKDLSRLEAKRLYLEDLTAVAQMLYAPPAPTRAAATAATTAPQSEAVALWTALAPLGVVEDLELRVAGELAEPSDVSGTGHIRDLALRAHRGIPGVHGLNGKFAFTRTTGRLEFDSSSLTVELPRVFREALSAERASGRVTWERDDEGLSVRGEKLKIASPDIRASGELQLRIPDAAPAEPHVKLRVDFSDGNAAHAARYYPRQLHDATRRFLERSILGGEITDGHLILDGVASRFPFRDGSGRFEIDGKARNLTFRYLPGWEPIRAATADVSIRGVDLRVTGKGKIGGLDLKKADVQLELEGEPERSVRVRGLASGPIAEAVAVLHAVKPAPGEQLAWKRYLPSGLTAAGDGELELALGIPLNEGATRIAGDYRVSRAALLFDAPRLTVEGLDGSVQFTESGPRSGTLRGRFLGGESMVVLASRDDGGRELQASGLLLAPQLGPILGPRITERLAGSAVWHATWRERDGREELLGEMSLDTLRAALPAPLNRPERLASAPLVIRTEASTRTSAVLALAIGEQASGRLALARGPSGWQLERGRLAFGEPRSALPHTREMQLAVRADAVDLDGWLELAGGRQDGPELPQGLTRFSVDAASLVAFGREFGRVAAELERGRDGWDGSLSGPAVAGRMRLLGAPLRALKLDLVHLHVPAARDAASAPRREESDPRRLPNIEARVQALRVKDTDLGQFELRGAPSSIGWAAEHFHLVRDDMDLTGAGQWLIAERQQSSRVDLKFESRDAGKTLEAFKIPDQLAGGKARIDASLSWSGTPTDLQVATVSGRLDVSAEKGQFLKAKPGAARLFGLVDLSSLSRYLQLDFSPIFGKGFVYDEIRGVITLERGNAYTRDLTIKGPSATLTFDGRVGLAAEDYDLVLGVAPRFGAGVTLGAYAVFGPQVAIAALALQQLFKEQIAEGTRILYVVKGPWNEPNITRVAVPEPGAEATSP
jgi:uncharacterized protein (TIGR02099 family)